MKSTSLFSLKTRPSGSFTWPVVECRHHIDYVLLTTCSMSVWCVCVCVCVCGGVVVGGVGYVCMCLTGSYSLSTGLWVSWNTVGTVPVSIQARWRASDSVVCVVVHPHPTAQRKQRALVVWVGLKGDFISKRVAGLGQCWKKRKSLRAL